MLQQDLTTKSHGHVVQHVHARYTSLKRHHVYHIMQAPSFTRNPHNGDVYSAYNKPEAVIDWLAHNEIEEDFVLILDADMIMRAPFIPEDLGAKEGTAISAYYGYLKVHCQLRHHNLDDTVSACIALNPLAVAVEYDVSINVGVSTLTSGSGPLSCACFPECRVSTMRWR